MNKFFWIFVTVLSFIAGIYTDHQLKPVQEYYLSEAMKFKNDPCKPDYDSNSGRQDGWHAINDDETLYFSSFGSFRLSTCEDFYKMLGRM